VPARGQRGTKVACEQGGGLGERVEGMRGRRGPGGCRGGKGPPGDGENCRRQGQRPSARRKRGAEVLRRGFGERWAEVLRRGFGERWGGGGQGCRGWRGIGGEGGKGGESVRQAAATGDRRLRPKTSGKGGRGEIPGAEGAGAEAG